MIEWLAGEAPLILSLTPMAVKLRHAFMTMMTLQHTLMESSLQAHKWNLWKDSIQLCTNDFMIFPWSEKVSAKIPGTRPKQTIGR